jgi:hypothetical protein
MAVLWRVLSHPGLTLVLTLLSAGLVAAMWMLPQLPGQLADEPVSSGRWLGDVSTEYGQWGSLFLALGLFHVVRSPLLFIVLTVMAAKVGAWLADEIAAALQLRAAAHVIGAGQTDVTEPLPMPAPPEIVREQVLLSTWPLDEEWLRANLAKSYPTVVIQSTLVDEPDATERRYLGLRNERFGLLRALAPGGMLLALTGVWLTVMLGEQVITPILAPGETYRSVETGLSVRYVPPLTVFEGSVVSDGTDPVEQADLISVGGQGDPPYPAVRVFFVEPGTDVQQAELGLSAPTTVAPNGARVTMWTEGAALWVASESPFLARPGSDRRLPDIGLAFNQRGGEESILLPDLSAGLRIVARPAGAWNDFLPIVVELYRSGREEPVLRGEVQLGERAIINLDGAEAIHVAAMPGVRVEARQSPGMPLVWIGLALVLASGVAFVRPPGFAVVQARLWPAGGTLVTVQSNRQESAAEILAALATQDPKPSS